MLRDFGWHNKVKIKNVAGNVINPATDEKLNELKALLQAIDDNTDTLEIKAEAINLNTDTLEAKVQSVRDQLDVLLSSRASEETLVDVLNALGAESGTDIVSELQNIIGNLTTLLATDFATETTLALVEGHLDTVETKLQVIIDRLDVDLSTRASEVTLQAVLDAIGQESGSDVITKLDEIKAEIEQTNYLLSPRPGLSVSQFLKNGSSPDLNVDGSSTPVDFQVSPPSGKIWYVHSVSVVMEDSSINFTKFAGIASLTNGVDFKIKENGLSEVTLENIKYNGEFYVFANNIILESSTIDILAIRIDTKKNTGTTMKLINSSGDYFKVTVNDDLTSINKFHVIVRGYEVDE